MNLLANTFKSSQVLIWIPSRQTKFYESAPPWRGEFFVLQASDLRYNDLKNAVDTRFTLFSISRPFTSVVLMPNELSCDIASLTSTTKQVDPNSAIDLTDISLVH